MRWTLLAVLFAAGCYNESKFVPEKTDAFCALLLECTDPAVLAFDGMTNESCQAFWGPQFRDEGLDCKFRRGAAKDCVSALMNATCPAEGSVADNLPEICGAVFTDCPVRRDTPDDTDPPGDTGTSE